MEQKDNLNFDEEKNLNNLDDTESTTLADNIEEENEEEFKNENLEVLEEIVEDFSFLYKDEDDVLANEKLKLKHRIFQIGVIVFLFLISILIIGGARMAMYQTSDIVTNQLVYKQDFARNTKEYYKYAIDFADEYDSMKYLNTISNEMDYNDAKEKIETYYNSINELDIGKIEDENGYYELYILNLKKTYNSISKIINEYEINKDYSNQTENFKSEMTKFANKNSNTDILDELVKSAQKIDYYEKILR